MDQELMARARVTRKNPYSDQIDNDPVLSRLDAQDAVLGEIKNKLDAPILNGGFQELTQQVNKVESIVNSLQASQESTGKKVDEIHAVVYDPTKGIIVTVAGHGRWLMLANKALKWILALLVTVSVTGFCKLLYDFLSGHILFKP